MKHDQSQKVALITGGGSGIGLAIAEKFIQNNMVVVIVGRNGEKLNAVKIRLGERCIPMACDLSDLSSIPGLVNRVMIQFGRIDILVNNAGINMKKDFVDVTDADFQQVLLTNVMAVFALSREVVKGMLGIGKGTIINISSMASLYGIPKVIAYTASKAAIDGMTRAMAVELSPKGIRVNSIAPGFIATEMSSKALDNDAERKRKVLSRTPMGYLGNITAIADAAFFLASDSSDYITGVVLPVDGGNSIGF